MQSGGSICILLAALGASPRCEAEQAGDQIVDPGHLSASIRCARLLGVIMGCASVLLVWVITRALYGQWAAVAAASLLVVHPVASFWSRFALRETAIGFLWLLGCLLVMRSSQKQARLSFFAAGFLLVAGSIEGLIAALLWIAISYIMRAAPPDFASISLLILVLGLGVFASDGPILLAISLCIVGISGLFVHLSGRETRSPSGSPCATNSRWATYGATVAILPCLFLGAKLGPGSGGSGGFDALYAAAAPRLFDFATMPMLIAASVGLGWAVVRTRAKDAMWLGYGILAVVVGFLVGRGASSFGTAAVPVLCVFAAAGVDAFSRMLKSSLAPREALRYVAPALILVILALPAAQSIGSIGKLSRETTLDAALEWLQMNAPKGARIAVEEGCLWLPSDQFDTMWVKNAGNESAQFYASEGVHFVVVSESSTLGGQSSLSKGPARGMGYAELLSAAKGYASFATSSSLVGPLLIVIIL